MNMRKILLSLLLMLCAVSVRADLATAQNNNIIVLASAAQTATVTSSDFVNNVWRGGHFVINCSAFTSGTFTAHIRGKDPISGNYYDILVATGSNVITGTGTIILKVYPGIGAVAGASTPDILPQLWDVQMVGAASPSATFSVSFFGEQ